MRPRMFEGEGYSLFQERGRKNVSTDAAKRFINAQAELIAFNMKKELKLTSTRSRRQAMSYLLEQCVLLCEAFPAPMREPERRQMRRVCRLVKRAKNAVRGEK